MNSDRDQVPVESKSSAKPELLDQAVWAAVILGSITAALIWLGIQERWPIEMVVKDVTSAARVPFYTGALSQVGIVLWSGALFICIFAGWQVASREDQRSERLFFLFGAVVTGLFLASDLFLVHELLAPRMGIPEQFVLGSYALFALAMLVVCRQAIREAPFVWLAFAFVFLGASVVVDQVGIVGVDSGSSAHFLIEDGAKIIGIGGWLLFFVFAAFRSVNRNLAEPTARREREPVRVGA
jgi:hypothetical protein